MEGELKPIHKLLNGAISNDLKWPLTYIVSKEILSPEIFWKFSPTAENFKAKFYVSIVCWNLRQMTKFYSVISKFDTVSLWHIKRNQLTRLVRRRTGRGSAVLSSSQRMNGYVFSMYFIGVSGLRVLPLLINGWMDGWKFTRFQATWLSCVWWYASGISQTSLKVQDHSGAKQSSADLLQTTINKAINDFRKRLNAWWWTFWTYDMKFIRYRNICIELFFRNWNKSSVITRRLSPNSEVHARCVVKSEKSLGVGA